MFSIPYTKEDFNREARKILLYENQIRVHNHFLLALLSKIRSSNEKGGFETADYSSYVQPSSPNMMVPNNFEHRSAAAELFIPDSGFVSTKIAVIAWENGMEGAKDNVTEVIVQACQAFVKNIITAMISKKKGYKVRDNKFQFGFNQPIPDPLIRNYNNVVDESLESKVDIDDEDYFKPKCRLALENVEQQVAFAYSCAKKKPCDNSLSVQLLYDTIKENPRILGLHSIQSISTFKLGLLADDDSID